MTKPIVQPPSGHWHELYPGDLTPPKPQKHICDGCPNIPDDCYPDTPTSCWMRPFPQE